MFIYVQFLSTIVTSPIKTFYIIIMCVYSSLSLWDSTGGVTVVDRYTDKHTSAKHVLNVYMLLLSARKGKLKQNVPFCFRCSFNLFYFIKLGVII